MPHIHERRFHGAADRLRSPERIALLEVDRVVSLVLEGLTAATVLDVGTGSAIFAEAFAARGLNAAGIDPNPAFLEAAREHAPDVDFREGIAEAIPYEDGAFDLCFLGHVLHETDDPVAALREARRVSKLKVAVLEWPFREEEIGPPLNHRLAADTILQFAREAGLSHVEHICLAHMDLYRMEVD